MDDSRTGARALASSAIARGEPLAWFDELYRDAARDPSLIPWADLAPNPNFVAWVARAGGVWAGVRALVVGCGLGDDAEYLAGIGAEVTAFDLSPAAIDWCGRRFPDSEVTYAVADLLDPPAAWRGAFDFVFEAYTLQAMPIELRPRAMDAMAAFLATGGRLLVITRGRDADEPAPAVPWPLLREEVEQFAERGLTAVSIEDYVEEEAQPVRRFRALFTR